MNKHICSSGVSRVRVDIATIFENRNNHRIRYPMDFKVIQVIVVSRGNMNVCSGALTVIFRRHVVVLVPRHNFLNHISKPAGNYRQMVSCAFDSNSPTKITYTIETIPAHVATGRLPRKPNSNTSFASRQVFAPSPSKAHSHRPVNRRAGGIPIAVYITMNALDAQVTAETAV